MNQLNTYHPDYAVHPGEILEEYLEAREMKKKDFANRTGLTEKTINQIIHGKAPISAKTALSFEKVLDVSAVLWTNLNANYYLFQEKQKTKIQLEKYVEWSKSFPLIQLIKRGYLPDTKNSVERIEGLLQFFGVSSPELWEKKYKSIPFALRHSEAFESSAESLLSWMRIGEIEGGKTDCSLYSDEKFKHVLQSIRSLTVDPPEVFELKMKELCKDAGVALAFVEEFPKTHLSGAARWMTQEKALIILSLRHKSDDHFWFSFFHEAGHILKHNKRFKTKYFVDEKNMESSILEDEANRFATEILIPKNEYLSFIENNPTITSESIIKFSDHLQIAPGILVGRLQYGGYLKYSQYNNLKKRFEFN